MQIAQAQVGTGGQNLPHHVIAVAQVMVKGQRAAVPYPARLNGIVQRAHDPDQARTNFS